MTARLRAGALMLAMIVGSLLAGCADAKSRSNGPAAVPKPSAFHGHLPVGPPISSGTPYPDAASASAAGGGFYVPNCPGHGTYYLQPNGGVATQISGGDAILYAYPPGSGYIVRPIPSNSVVTPQQVTAQGQTAYGYEGTPGIVQVTSTEREGVLEHSYLTWANRGSSMHLSSASQLSLSDLEHIADSCT